MKRSVFSVSTTLALLSFSLPVFSMDTSEMEVSNNPGRVVPSLKTQVSKSIFSSLENDAEKGDYKKVGELRDPEICIQDLQELIFSDYYIPKTPLDFTFMGFMTNVDLSNVSLKAILIEDPTSLSPLGKSMFLKTLSVRGNDLCEHGTVLSSFTNLTQLDVSCNQLGQHVTALSPLTNLNQLDVGNNPLGKYVSALTPLTNLTWLDVDRTELGQEGSVLSHLKGLRVLDVSDNFMGGPTVCGLSSLTNLISLSIENNYFFCSDGSSLNCLTNLKRLRVGEDGLVEDPRLPNYLNELYIDLNPLRDRGVRITYSGRNF